MDLFDIAVASKLAGGGGGGGGSSYTLLAEDDIEVSNPSTSGAGTLVKTFQLGSTGYTSDKIIYVRVRIKSDYEKPHFFCGDAFSCSPFPGGGGTTDMAFEKINYDLKADGTWHRNSFGITPIMRASGALDIYARGDTTYNMNGTYHVEVYALDWPDGVSPYN